ncbi:hypothetical protein ACFYTF_09295 [Nocardia thailandica]|uniref:Uncharacterized protein n=1 Tax=Nocardia thailandica TaxID=257275 RepID=A0ABW6PKU5_9NOCA
MRHRTTLRATVAATALALSLTGAGLATAAPDAAPVRDRGHHAGTGSAGRLLSGSAEAGSAAVGSAAELAACTLLEPIIPLPICLLLA